MLVSGKAHLYLKPSQVRHVKLKELCFWLFFTKLRIGDGCEDDVAPLRFVGT